MKAITLHQPWASLVALGVKTIETRSWSTKYRGPLAIHAGARQVHTGNFLLLARRALTAGLIDAETEQRFRSLDVPFGAVVATCTLVDVVPMSDLYWSELPIGGWQFQAGAGRLTRHDPLRILPTVVNVDQRPFGDFSPGRFAWLLADVEPVEPHIPARGRQQLWEWSPEPLTVGAG